MAGFNEKITHFLSLILKNPNFDTEQNANNQEMAIKIINLIGGERAFEATYQVIADRSIINNRNDMFTDAVLMDFFNVNEALVLSTVNTMAKQSEREGLADYVWWKMRENLSREKTGKALTETTDTNDEPSSDRVQVCTWMVLTCMKELCKSYATAEQIKWQ